MDWGSIASGAGSLLGGITSSIFSHSAMKKQLKAQAEENQKNRDFNAEQSRLAQQYNSRMVNEQNQYDSPAAQMDRLKEAGLNPNLVYGQMGNGSVGVGSTSMQGSSSGSVGSGLPDYSGLLQGVLGISKMAMEFAQGRKSESEITLNEIEAANRDELLKSEISVAGVTVRLKESDIKHNEADINKLAQDVTESKQRIAESAARIKKMAYENQESAQRAVGLILDNKLKSATFDDLVRQCRAQTSLSEQEARLYTRRILAEIFQANASGVLSLQLKEQSSEFIEKIKQDVNESKQNVDESKQRVSTGKAQQAVYEQQEKSLQYDNNKSERHEQFTGSTSDNWHSPKGFLQFMGSALEFAGDLISIGVSN